MIDYKIENRDLVKKGDGGDVQLVKGIEAKKQSMILRLTIERGSFIYDETLGSQLKMLLNEKRSQIPSKAKIYVIEALATEKDIEIINVTTKWLDRQKILITTYFRWNGMHESLEVEIS